MTGYSTGWFGALGVSKKGSSRVHLVYDEKPLCGWKPRSGLVFQWCAFTLVVYIVECKRCLKAFKKQNLPRAL